MGRIQPTFVLDKKEVKEECGFRYQICFKLNQIFLNPQEKKSYIFIGECKKNKNFLSCNCLSISDLLWCGMNVHGGGLYQ